jgi:molecular chaperone HtpG
MDSTTESNQQHFSNEESYAFQAEISQLLSIIINTFYSNKDIFLRELISNASDAIDKIRYQNIQSGETNVLGNETNFNIKIIPDRQNQILIIEDTGIGMTKDELVHNLGTIAHSGTKEFMQKLATGSDMSLIGQFGVGFYSAFLVADQVDVYSRHYTSNEEYCWRSNANGSFSVARVENPSIERGTRIVLHLKPEQIEFTDEHKIKDIIQTHSQFISYPIYLQVTKTRELDISDDDITETEFKDDSHEHHQHGGEHDEQCEHEHEHGDDEQCEHKHDEDNDEPHETITLEGDDEMNEFLSSEEMNDKRNEIVDEIKKNDEETYTEMEIVNKTTPIWMKNKDEISETEYNSFYKSISGDYDDPLTYTHFTIEGQIVFRGLLYIPKRAPFDMFNSGRSKVNNIKLYVRRVFITDKCDDFVPDYLGFIKGVVDSDDLPLNISREMLQQNSIYKVIQKQLVKKILDMLYSLSENDEKYMEFYHEFSKNLKLGIHEDANRREKIAQLLRYPTTKSSQKMCSLDEYISRMREGQKDIYYLTGQNFEEVASSTHLDIFHKRNMEVVLMSENIDEYCVSQLREYKGHSLVNITRSDIELLETDEEKKHFENEKTSYQKLCQKIKKVLGNSVTQVSVSNRLVGSPCCVSVSQFGWSPVMERLMKSQAMANGDMSNYMSAQRQFDLNPNNNIIKSLNETANKNDEDFDLGTINLVHLLYETALHDAGFSVPSSRTYAHRVYSIVELGLGYQYPHEQDMPDLTNLIADGMVTSEK